jgi:TPP-dependent pyruvate/acetoin dehydrogenase alpha subunit
MSQSDYWTSEQGTIIRLEALAQDLVWGSYNETIVVLAPGVDPNSFLIYQTAEDEDVCEICDGNRGEYDFTETNLPDLPAHVNCRCEWYIA